MYNCGQKEGVEQGVAAQLIVMGRYETHLGNRTVSYVLKRSTQAKLIWLDIKRKTGLTVTVPYTYNIRCLQDYLVKNTKWILRNLDKYCNEETTTAPADIRPSQTISYLGKSLKVMQKSANDGLTAIKLQQNKIVVSSDFTKGDFSHNEVEQWLKSRANKLINEKVKHFASQMGLTYNRVMIRDQKSRWGSCSCRKNLNFNWRLVMAPEPVLDYVIIHELCHLKDMSHSASFWEIVAQHCPKWHEYRDWLDNHCIELNAQLQF